VSAPDDPADASPDGRSDDSPMADTSAAEVEADAAALVEAWRTLGATIDVDGVDVWFADRAAEGGEPAPDVPPLLVLHGFPTCSFDWRSVLPALTHRRRVVLIDQPGFGLSGKPDQRYSIRGQADVVEAVVDHLGLPAVDLLTHDMGDSIGGELLHRSLAESLGFRIRRRVLTNGSIYLDLAQLTVGQQLLLGLADEVLTALEADGGAAFRDGVAATFAPSSPVDPVEMAALGQLAHRGGGLTLLPRTIRYVEDRRLEERRYTGAIEAHPSPLGVVWGRLDPVAVHAMTDRLREARPDTPVITLDDVGHYPMIEAPGRFAEAVLSLLDAP
jgi:pimeloyl-ACP methyl ester carboxylesterase